MSAAPNGRHENAALTKLRSDNINNLIAAVQNLCKSTQRKPLLAVHQ